MMKKERVNAQVDTAFERLLDDLKQYCEKKDIEKECREYAKRKRGASPGKGCTSASKVT